MSIIVSLRIMGKRQMGELEPSELVVAVLISDLAAHPLQEIGIPLLYGIIPVLTLLCLEVILSGAMLKNLRFYSFLSGKPSVIIENGRIAQNEMKKNRFTLDELVAELRKKNVLDISTVSHAILETDGSLSVLVNAGDAPATPNQLGVNVDNTDHPVIVIDDGRILHENLKRMGYNENWLNNQLKLRKITSAKDVYILSVEKSGKIYFTKKEAVK